MWWIILIASILVVAFLSYVAGHWLQRKGSEMEGRRDDDASV